MGFNTGLPNPLSKYYTLEELDIVITEVINNNNPGQSHNLLQGILRNMLSIVKDVRDAAPVDPGSSAGREIYTAGNGGSDSLRCRVTATDTGITYAVASGVGTITIPEDVQLISFTVKGETSITSGGNFTVRLSFPDLNDDINTANLIVWQVINASALDSVATPSTGNPLLVDNDNVPQKQFTVVDSNIVDITVPSINAFTDWFIVGIVA